MRWWQDAGRPCGEVISAMEERVSRGSVIQAQQGQCITIMKCFQEKKLNMRRENGAIINLGLFTMVTNLRSGREDSRGEQS